MAAEYTCDYLDHPPSSRVSNGGRTKGPRAAFERLVETMVRCPEHRGRA